MHAQDFESPPIIDADVTSNATLRYARAIYQRRVEHVLEKTSDLI